MKVDVPFDMAIGSEDRPQTLRFHLLKWRGLQLALHLWLRSDDDRALHDHSSWNISLILGPTGYYEVFKDRTVYRRPWVPYLRRAATPHRVVLPPKTRYVATLWLRGKPWREWGFHCPRGWKHWRDYTSTRDYSAPGSVSAVGAGCD